MDEIYKMIKINNLNNEEEKDLDLYLHHILKDLQKLDNLKKNKNYYKNLHKVFSQLINEK